MMNLTTNIKLDPRWQRAYVFCRWLIFLAAALGTIYAAYLALFPKAYFNYSFSVSGGKNSFFDLTDSEGTFPSGGKISSADDLMFYAYTPNRFSKIKLNINTAKDPLENARVKVKKSHRALFYPEGEPIGFEEGSLVKSGNDYYIMSEGKLRKFASDQAAEKMGFNLNAFFLTQKDDPAIDNFGPSVVEGYPDSTVFKHNEDYYSLKKGSLEKYVSQRAYLSNFSENTAVAANNEIIGKYELSEDELGFSNGTLLSFDGSVFIVSGQSIFPVLDPVFFEAMGLKWENVIAADPEEIGIYHRGKTTTPNTVHPDGLILANENEEEYFYIEDGKRRPLKSPAVANSYYRSGFIPMINSGIETRGTCAIHQSLLGNYSARCIIDLSDLINLPGISYHYELDIQPDTRISDISSIYSQDPNYENLRASLGRIKNNILTRFYGKI